MLRSWPLAFCMNCASAANTVNDEEPEDVEAAEETDQVDLAIKLNLDSSPTSALSVATREHLRKGRNYSWLIRGTWSAMSADASTRRC